jgi:hypothetical protein
MSLDWQQAKSQGLQTRRDDLFWDECCGLVAIWVTNGYLKPALVVETGEAAAP